MKRVLVVLVFLSVAFALHAVLPCRAAVLAQAGCCMQRVSYNAAWIRVRVPFEECRRQNDQKDADNVLNEQGLWWWNARC